MNKTCRTCKSYSGESRDGNICCSWLKGGLTNVILPPYLGIHDKDMLFLGAGVTNCFPKWTHPNTAIACAVYEEAK